MVMKTDILDRHSAGEKHSDAGFTPDPLPKLLALLEKKEVSSNRFQQILESGILADVLDPAADLRDREAVRRDLKLGPVKPAGAGAANPSEELNVVVDYSMTLEQMVAAGNYDWKNEDIISRQFSVLGEGRPEFEVQLFNFGRSISSEDAERAIKEAVPSGQWELGRIEHLLAFGAKYPETQRKFPIVCLGSVSNSKVFGKRHVPYLYRRVLGRSLHMDWYSNGWHSFYRFLGVRKKSCQ
jgi:hypothetical protein